MPFVAAPNTIMAEMRMLIGVNRLENVLYFQGSAGVNTTLMTTLGNNLANWWDASLTPQLSTQLQLVEVYLTDLTTQTSPTVSSVLEPIVYLLAFGLGLSATLVDEVDGVPHRLDPKGPPADGQQRC